MDIAIIGAGRVGRALGLAWQAAGHRIVFGVRAKGDADQAGPARFPVAEAAGGAGVIVVAVPWSAMGQVTDALAPAAGGEIVIDCTNPLVYRDGHPGLDPAIDGSGAKVIADRLPGARVVKSLNQVGAEVLGDAGAYAPPPAMFMAGDDQAAKTAVAGLLADLHFDPLDAGDLASAGLLESLAAVWINQAMARGKGRTWALAVTSRGKAGA